MTGEPIASTRFVLTGPTGWIGSAMMAHLATRLGPAWRTVTTCFGSSARDHVAPDGRPVAIRPLPELRPSDLDDAIVIHLAYLTKEKVDLLGERAFTDANLAIDDHVLNALRTARPKGVFVASSGAAAMAEDGRDRHPYGLAKLRQEDRFLAWGAEAGTPVLAGRIFNLAGPYINKVESYAISSFIAQARRTRIVHIGAVVPVFRSYLHVDDLCALAIGALERGVVRTRPVDLCGAEVLEMQDIAAAVAAHVGSDVSVLRGNVDPSRPSVYLGNFTQTKALAIELGLPVTGFLRQLADTATGMSQSEG
jgi:nucleoside-diphosphate-sugar epimerase